MKPALLLASAAVALSAGPAFADNGQIFDAGAQLRAFPTAAPSQQCFSGRLVSGISRAGDKTLYVQSRTGSIYRLRLPGACAALDAAQKIALRADGGDVICPGSAAVVVATTPAGAQRCAVADVRGMSPRETTALAAAARR